MTRSSNTAADMASKEPDVTRDEFSRCITLIRRYWPHGTASWSAEVFETWESLLLDLDHIATAAAIQTLATEGREWPPPPGVVRKKVCDLVNPLPSADQAWGEVREQIRRVGSTRGMAGAPEVVWSHPLVGQVADRMGWQELCMSTNEMADRAHFLKMWETASSRERTATALPPATRQALEARGIALPNLRLGELDRA